MTKNVVTVVDKPSWFSAGDVSEDELLTMAIDDHTWDGVLAIYTDKVEWTLQDELDREHLHNLLEIRAYTEEEELHASRDALGSGFAWRLVNDVRAVAGAATYDARFDDVQYLDIDRKRSGGRDYVTTGGGSFRLPIVNAEKIVVRNYIRYGEDDGMARIVDFRVVRLCPLGKEGSPCHS